MRVKIFCCHTQEDEALLNELLTHLAPLKEQGSIEISDDRNIAAGDIKNIEIKKRLDAADIILLLISPDFLASEYCTQIEIGRVLERQKRDEVHIIPVILRYADWRNTDLSILEPFPADGKPVSTWPDRDEVFYYLVEHIKQVVKNVAGGIKQAVRLLPSPTRYDFYEYAPSLAGFIRRPQVLTDVCAVLLNNASTLPRPHILHGMGGIGKTTIARAVCEDAEIYEVFSDGILWATLGKNAEITSCMRDWIEVLGGTIHPNNPSKALLQNTLTKLLKNRACLLIVDDVWKRTDAKAFLVGGPRCRLLITTRDAEIARDRELNATIQQISLMQEHEAISLLEEWADGRLAETDIVLKRNIVQRLGYLPLAIKLAGPQLRAKSATEWLYKFDIYKLKSQRVEIPLDSLEWTFERSTEELDEENARLYFALSIFKQDEAIPQIAIERLWRSLNGKNDQDTVELLDDLATRNLLSITMYRSNRMIQIHDLLHDFISNKMNKSGKAYKKTHESLLREYRCLQQGDGWHTVPDDGYLYDHLAYHLHAGEAEDELKNLFSTQYWLHVRVPQRNYTYDGYLEDLSLAWRCAEIQVLQQIEAQKECVALADCVRYLLIQASINSLSTNYIPGLVRQAVKIGLWKPERALSIAARIPDDKKRTAMYLAIINTNKISEQNAIKHVIQAALSLEDEEERAQMLVALAPGLEGEEQEKVLKDILEATLTIKDKWASIEIMKKLASFLTSEMLKYAFHVILFMEDRDRQIEILAAFLSGLEGEEREKAFLSGLEGEEREKVLKIFVEATLSTTDELRLLTIIIKLDHQLGISMLKHAIQVTDNNRQRASMLVALAPWLEGRERKQRLEQAVQVTLTIDNEWERLWMLATLAPQLEGEQRERVLKYILERTLSDKDLWVGSNTELLAKIAPLLEKEEREDVLKRALKATLSIQEEWMRLMQHIRIATTLAPLLEEVVREKMLKHALEITLSKETHFTKEGQAMLLEELSPQLGKELLIQAIQPIPDIASWWKQVNVLLTLASRLEGNLFNRALEIALSVDDSQWPREDMPIVLASPRPQRDPAIQWLQEDMLIALAPRLEGESLKQAVQAALVLPEFVGIKPLVLVALAHQLKGEERESVLKHALEIALASRSESAPIIVMERLAPLLDGNMLVHAVLTTLAVKNEWWQAGMLAALVPRLKGQQWKGVLRIALEIALTIESEWGAITLMKNLASRFDGSLLMDVVQATLSIENEKKRAGMLAALIPRLKREEQERVLKVALETTFFIDDEKRSVAVLETLSPYLKKELLKHALEVALSIEDDEKRAKLLTVLAPQLEGEGQERVLKVALEAVLSIETENRQVETLIKLTPQLESYLLKQAIEAILSMKDDKSQTAVFLALASEFEWDLFKQLIEPIFTAKKEKALMLMFSNYLSSKQDYSLALKTTINEFLRFLHLIGRHSHQDLMEILDNFRIFSLPVFPKAIANTIVFHFIEISQQWEWL